MKKKKENKEFQPQDYMIELEKKRKNSKTNQWETVYVKYMPVNARVFWARTERPLIKFFTVPIVDLKTAYTKGVAIFRTSIIDEEGRVLATATKVETRDNFPDFIEKAETGSIGRALALVGYGTLAAPELAEEERIVDAPVEKKSDESEEINPDDIPF
jgi:hypothetical protein